MSPAQTQQALQSAIAAATTTDLVAAFQADRSDSTEPSDVDFALAVRRATWERLSRARVEAALALPTFLSAEPGALAEYERLLQRADAASEDEQRAWAALWLLREEVAASLKAVRP